MIALLGILDFSTADLIAIAPSSGAEMDEKDPLNYSWLTNTLIVKIDFDNIAFAVGVLDALIMYTSWSSPFVADKACWGPDNCLLICCSL